jgi:heptosyltransferase-2
MERTPLFSSAGSKPEFPTFHGRPVTDLVWLQTSFIGDMILNTAAMELASREFPGIRQSVITTATGVAIYRDLPFIDRTFLFAKRKGSSIASIASIRATAGAVRAWGRRLPPGSNAVILQAHKSFRSSMVSRMTGLPVITYRETSRVPLWLKRDVSVVDRVIPFHESARIGMLLEPLGIPREKIVAARPTLAARPSPDTARESTSHDVIRIAIAPGSVWGTKRWLPDRFARLAVELLANVPGSKIVLTGSPDEAALCEAIERKISDRSRVENLAGKTALKDLPEFFSGFDLVVTNDSSPAHYAAAVDVPTVEIFGATIPEFGFGPLASTSRVVQAGRLDCRPCSDHGPQVCPESHFRCMKDIAVEDVRDACLSLLQSSSEKRS